MESSATTYEVGCHACGRKFRLTVNSEHPPVLVVCPRCGASINVMRGDATWRRLEHSEVFGRAPEAAPPEPAASRVFQDISSVDPAGAPPRPAIPAPKAQMRALTKPDAPSDPIRRAPTMAILKANKHRLDEKLASAADQAPEQPRAEAQYASTTDGDAASGTAKEPILDAVEIANIFAASLGLPAAAAADDASRDQAPAQAETPHVSPAPAPDASYEYVAAGASEEFEAKQAPESPAAPHDGHHTEGTGTDLDARTSENRDHETQDATRPEGDAPPTAAPRNVAPVVLGALVVVFIVVAVAYLIVPVPPKTDTTPPKPDAPVISSEGVQFATLTADNAGDLAKAVARLRNQSVEVLRTDLTTFLSAKNFGDAQTLLDELRRREPESAEWRYLEIDVALGLQDFSEARRLALDTYLELQEPRALSLYTRAVDSDPRLRERPVDVVDTFGIDTVRALGGGRSVSFKLKRGDTTVFAFKPAQDEWNDGWRSEVAAWRFCELVPCGFMVPRSRPGKIRRSDFEAMYARDDEKQRGYSRRFDALHWTTETDLAGNEVEVLYGVVKDWVLHFQDWPIEYTDVWTPWLRHDAPAKIYETPVSKAVRVFEPYMAGKYTRRLLQEDDGGNVRRVAAQLSNITTFDYIVNNWDRYSAQEEYYGVNNQFANGRFVSLDNGAAFHTKASYRVDQRFEPVQRFSKRFIQGLEVLQPAWVDPILFDSPTDEEKRRLKVFWQRRDSALKRVDKLVEKYGSENVLYFD